MTLDSSFLPLNLTWSHVGGVVRASIHAGLFHNCDLLNIVEDTKLARSLPHLYPDPSLFMFNTEVRPTKVGSGLWPTLKPPGLYELDIVTYGSNARPSYKTLTIEYRSYYPDEPDMFSRGLIITVDGDRS
jgi:hypothetical protein